MSDDELTPTLWMPRPPDQYQLPSSGHAAARLALPDADAFNGSLVTTRGKTLLVYRTARDVPSLACCYLDDGLRAVQGSHRHLPLYRNADPRLFEFHGEVYLLTSYFGAGFEHERVELRKVPLGQDAIGPTEVVAKFDHIDNDPAYRKGREKNWAPFVHGDALYFVHRMRPHRILRYDPSSRGVSLVAQSHWAVPQDWPSAWHGDLRLNTNPVRLSDGTYLSTFHACVADVGYHSGFYRFEGEPPFRVVQVSSGPVVRPADATGVNLRYCRSGVIFLQQLILGEGNRTLRLTGGDNDHSVVVIDMPIGDALGALTPIAALPSSVIEPELFFSVFRAPRGAARLPAGRVSANEMAAMLALIDTLGCKRLAEFGVGTGANAASILQACPHVESYVGIDVPPGTVPSLAYQAGEVPERAGELALADPRFKLIMRDRGTMQVRPEELAPLDFVFIDGDHGVEAVRRDTELARRSMGRGVICWHDYDNAPAIGPKVVIDDLNAMEGGHICLLKGTTLCFEIRR